MSEGNKKDWERPWSTEKIRDNAGSWNLACDAALLNTLKSFGDKLISRSEEVYTKVENLCDDLEKTSLRVDLARNEFNSLRNTQFVECRVYEEDETLLSVQNQEEKAEKTNVPKEETMEDLKDAVALSLNILDKYFDKVELNVSDSEDEDMPIVPSYVYRRKDPYLHRPLPYVIGSEEWYKKWHVGLQESSDSENEKSASEKFSDSESENDFKNKNDSDASSEFSNDVSTGRRKSQDYLASSSSDVSTAPTPKPTNFAEQLAAKLGNVIRKISVEEPEINRRPIQKKTSDYGALFSEEPPPIVDQQPSSGLFSGGKGLFDEDDNDSLWNEDDVVSSIKNNPLGSSLEKQNDRSLVRSRGLFDDDDTDDEDDLLFGISKKTINKTKPTFLSSNNTRQVVVPIFQEEPPVLESENPLVKDKKKPIGGVPILGHGDIFEDENVGKILKQRRDEDKEAEKIEKELKSDEKSGFVEKSGDEDDKPKVRKVEGLFDEEKPRSGAVKSGLFDDDLFGDDDLFSSNFLTKRSENNSALFGEEKISKNEEQELIIENEYDYSWREINSDIDKHKEDEGKPKDGEKSQETQEKKSTKPILSLFDDDYDEVDDLFSNILKNDKKMFGKSEKTTEIGNGDTKTSSVKVETSTEVSVNVETSTVNDLTSKFGGIGQSGVKRDENEKIGEKESAGAELVIETSNIPDITSKCDGNVEKIDATDEKESTEVDISELSSNVKDITSIFVEEESQKGVVISNSRRYGDVPAMNFMDSTPPPPDDAWETNSDNAFDDFYQPQFQNDVYQSRSSSLFDNEPPSLFFDDVSATDRVTSSNRSVDGVGGPPNFQTVPETNEDVFANDETSSDNVAKDETDDFVCLKSDNDNSEIKIIIEDDKKVIEKKGTTNDKDKIIISEKDCSSEVETDEMLGSNIAKITEKLQQLQSNKTEEKPKHIPRKLSHNLKINVGALLPGSAPPKKDAGISGDLSKSVEERVFERPMAIVRTVSESDSSRCQDYRLEKSVSFDENIETEILQSVTKNRVRVPVRRKPSSRRTRNEFNRLSVPNFTILAENATEPPKTEENEETQQSVKKEEINQSVKEETVSFLEDETEDIFQSIIETTKTINKAEIISTKTDDLFYEHNLNENHSKNNKIEKENSSIEENKKSEGSMKAKLKKNDIFGSSDDDDDFFFGSTKDRRKGEDSISEIKGKTKDVAAKPENSSVVKKIGLFSSSEEDDDDDDLFSQKKKMEKSKKNTPIPIIGKDHKKKIGENLFGSSDDDDDFFGSLGVKKGKTELGKTKKDVQPAVIHDKKETSKSSNNNLRKLENVEGNEDPLSALLK